MNDGRTRWYEYAAAVIDGPDELIFPITATITTSVDEAERSVAAHGPLALYPIVVVERVAPDGDWYLWPRQGDA